VSSWRRPLPALLLTPRYCVVWGKDRMLKWGIFDSRAEAELTADIHCKGAPTLRSEIRIEPIFILRRNL
jgi:hypothetical protein